MKNLVLFFFSLSFSCVLPAQDLIELVSGEEIEGTVLEVGYEIRYLRADFADGPIYVLERTEVLMITYANGREEIINLEAAQQDGSFAVRQSYLKIRGSRYYEGFRQISQEDFLLKLQQDPALFNQYQKGRLTQRAGYFVTGGGVVLGLIGAATMGRSNFDNAYSFQPPGRLAPPRTGLLWTGMGISLVGVGIIAAGTQKVNQALDNYNIQVGRTGSLQPLLNEEGMGVVFTF